MGSGFREFRSAAPILGLFVVLSGCDAGDYTLAGEDSEIGSSTQVIDFKNEVAFLTKTCFAALEKKSAASPDLTRFGYEKTTGNSFKKTGPKISAANILGGPSRSAVSFKYTPGRSNSKNNTCSIRVDGLERNIDANKVTEKERSVVSASLAAAKSLGYQEASSQSSFRNTSNRLFKGSNEIVARATAEYQFSIRSLNIRFFGDR
ncbi:MAG: hypothetical protein AAFN80_04715 [Pseudomonadota bacterium]